MLAHSKVKTFQEELDEKTAKHSYAGMYRPPKFDKRAQERGRKSLFVSYGIKENIETKGIVTCCKKNMIYFNCSICDIHIKFIVPNYITYMNWKVVEFHQHNFDEHIFTVNGKIWNKPHRTDEFMEIFPIDKMATADDKDISFINLDCLLCKEKYPRKVIKNITRYVKYLIRRYMEERKENEYVARCTLMNEVHDTFMDRAHRHLLDCPKINEIRKSLFGEDNRVEHNRLADGIRHEIYTAMAKYRPPTNDPNIAKYGYILTVEKCKCGDGCTVECKLCGIKHDANINGYTNIRNKYELIIRRHIVGSAGIVNFDYTDLLAPINRRQVYKGRIVTHRQYNYVQDVMEEKQKEIPVYVCDGYKCAVCGMEYETCESDGLGVSVMPNKTIVLTHLAECVESSRQEIINSGRLCIA